MPGKRLSNLRKANYNCANKQELVYFSGVEHCASSFRSQSLRLKFCSDNKTRSLCLPSIDFLELYSNRSINFIVYKVFRVEILDHVIDHPIAAAKT